MRLFALCFFIALNFIVFNSCKDNGVESKLEPGKRDYEWKEDTLKMGNERLTLTRLWVNNPQNIWVLGSGSTSSVELWHYNGVKWENANEPVHLKIIQVKAIYGFQQDNIWMGTGENQIWRYDGKSWNLFQKLTLEGYDRITIENIYGRSQNDIYAVGYALNYSTNEFKGIILHYGGDKWEFKNIENIRANFEALEISSSGLVYILAGGSDEKGFFARIFTFDGNHLKEIVAVSYEGYGIGKAGGEVYINSNQKIYKYTNNSLQLWKDFSGTSFMANIQGRHEKDFINAAYDGIGHYNGTDYKTIYKTNLSINGYSILEKDIFVITKDFNTGESIIIHGWLK